MMNERGSLHEHFNPFNVGWLNFLGIRFYSFNFSIRLERISFYSSHNKSLFAHPVMIDEGGSIKEINCSPLVIVFNRF